MTEGLSVAPELTFQLPEVFISGLSAGIAALLFFNVMLAVFPVRFPANVLYVLGSAVSIETTAAYLWGIVVYFTISMAYASVVAAVLVGFEAGTYGFVWGLAAGAFLSVVSGTTLAYARNLNRSVRSGLVSDPAPFLIRFGRWSVAQLVTAHLLFGALAGQIYLALA